MQPIKYRSIPILLSFALAACTTLQPLEGDLSKLEVVEAIDPGDEIKIVTKASGQHLIKVDSVTADKISGGGREFKLEDIERIEVEKSIVGDMASGMATYVGVQILIYVIVLRVALGGL